MLAHHVLRADVAALARLTLLYIVVTTVVLGASTTGTAATAPRPAMDISTDGPRERASAGVLADPASFAAFAQGGVASSATGLRIAESGAFAIRADVVTAQHTIVRLAAGEEQQTMNLSGARIFGLFRGASDLTTLEGARVVLLGSCPAGTSQLNAACTVNTVEVGFARHEPFPVLDTPSPA